MDRSAGFTLIEIIVSLVIVGILAAIAGMGLTTGIKGYLFAKENAHMSQKAQLAMARLNREMMELLDIVTPTSSSIIYEHTSGNRAIAKVGSTIKVRDGSALPDTSNGDILIDNVTSFTLSYFKADQTWVPGTDSLQLLSAIRIDMEINRADSGIGDVAFSTTVHPRNTKNYGGAAPTSNPPSKAAYGCFASGLAPDAMRGSHLVGAGLLCLCILLRSGTRFLPSGPILPALRARAGSAPRGSVIIGLIATMVVFSALGAVILPLTSTSTFSEVGSNNAAKAYFLAEAGYRYAASEYLNTADDDAKDAALISLHDQTYNLAGNDGRFHLDMDAYWFKTTSDPNGSRNLETRVTGGVPPYGRLRTGFLSIDGTVYEYSRARIRGTDVTFRKRSGTWPSIAVGTSALNVGRSWRRSQTVTKGGDLRLNRRWGARVFPPRNGQFQVNGNTYNYKELNRRGSLTGITDPDDDAMPDFTVPANTYVTLEKYLSISSTGTFAPGQGMETNRTIAYSTPIGWVPRAALAAGKTEVTDSFDDTSQWKSSTLGSHGIASVDGSNALDVTGTSRIGLSRTSLIAFDWANTDADLAAVWDAAGKLLSYDAQAKVKYADTTYYMAGISFRVDNSSNRQYGISYLKSASSGFDGIPDTIVPSQGQLMVVLWQQTSRWDRKWLAYKTLSSSDYIETYSTLFSDDMESGTGNWSAESPWAQTTGEFHSTTTSWKGRFVGQSNQWQYRHLTLNAQDLSAVSAATLRFWHKGMTSHWRDRARVQIRKKNGSWSSWSTLATYTGNFNTWREVAIDISSWLPKEIQIRFQTRARKWSSTDGWWVDDVTISSEAVDWPTMVLRLEEQVADAGRFSGQKVNDIQVYIGDVNAHGTPGTDPLDDNRRANPRGQTEWPPDDVADTASSNDYFTLIQWDSSIDSSVDRLGSGSELNTIIRSNAITTPGSGSFAWDEVALHTWGWLSTSVFFDDFSIQHAATSGGGVGFLNPIQE